MLMTQVNVCKDTGSVQWCSVCSTVKMLRSLAEKIPHTNSNSLQEMVCWIIRAYLTAEMVCWLWKESKLSDDETETLLCSRRHQPSLVSPPSHIKVGNDVINSYLLCNCSTKDCTYIVCLVLLYSMSVIGLYTMLVIVCLHTSRVITHFCVRTCVWLHT